MLYHAKGSSMSNYLLSPIPNICNKCYNHGYYHATQLQAWSNFFFKGQHLNPSGGCLEVWQCIKQIGRVDLIYVQLSSYMDLLSRNNKYFWTNPSLEDKIANPISFINNYKSKATSNNYQIVAELYICFYIPKNILPCHKI